MIDRVGVDRALLRRRLRAGAPDVGAALDSFSTRALALDLRPTLRVEGASPGVCYFFPRPSAGSAASG